MKHCKNCNKNYPEDKKFCKKCGEPLIEAYEFNSEEATEKVLTDTSMWFKKNLKTLTGILILLVIPYSVYYFMLQRNPEKDANKIVTSYCDCYDNHSEEVQNFTKKFLNSFDPQKYRSQSDAIMILRKPTEKAMEKLNLCLESVSQKTKTLRSKYESNNEDLIIFNNIVQTSQPGHREITLKKLAIEKELQDKINTIVDPPGQIQKSAIN